MNIRELLETLDAIESGCPGCGGPITLAAELDEGKKDACPVAKHTPWARKGVPRRLVANAVKIPTPIVQAKQ